MYFGDGHAGRGELPISQAQQHLAEVVSRAEHAQERTVLTRDGKPVAVVISIEDLRGLQAAADEADLVAARILHNLWGAIRWPLLLVGVAGVGVGVAFLLGNELSLTIGAPSLLLLPIGLAWLIVALILNLRGRRRSH